MARKPNRNSSLIFAVGVILLLIFAVAFAAKAQVSQGTPSTKLDFRPPVVYDSGAFLSTSVAVGDLNGDGKLDIVVTNSCLSYDDCPFNDILDVRGHPTVGVLLGNGNGTFKPVVTYETGGFQRPDMWSSVTLADMNGDGILDIIVINSCGYIDDCAQGTVSVLVGNGDGTFRLSSMNWSSGFLPAAVAVGDVNRDGKPDLLVANTCFEQSTCDENTCTCPTGSVAVFLADGYVGGPGFHDGEILKTEAPWTRAIATGDLNKDGNLDVVAANDGSVSVLLGSGQGSFQSPVIHNIAGLYVASVALADVNGDGKLDLLVANGYVGAVSVFLGNGDGTFRSPWLYNLGGSASSLAVGDLNGDGKPDLAIATSSGIAVLLGNGNGTFQSPATFGSRSDWSYAVAIGDVNGDGKPDLVTANEYSPLGFYVDSAAGVWINNSGATTSTVMASSLNPSFVGQPVTFTATTWSVAGFPADGEVITFKNGSATLGTGILKGARASLTTSSLPVGTFNITASYAGDKKFAASTSSALLQVVKSTTKSLTSTLLVSSLNPSVYGQNVIWAAKVSSTGPHPPTGNVFFRWSRDGQNYNIGTAALNASGVAMVTSTSLSANPYGSAYPLVGVYSGDAFNLGSTSAVLLQDVLQTKTAATITSSLNPSKLGQPVTFTAKITSPTVMPTGPVTFSIGYTNLGTAQLSGGTAKFTTSALPVGSSRVKVTYYGNSNIAKSSASILQAVQ
jgi:Bacterial Ig-like domain (group 3)/FG-GAP-like repeat/FG-GAP repeat